MTEIRGRDGSNGSRYEIQKRIGGGSFGEIFLGMSGSGDKVAVKFEKQSSKVPQLRHEYKVYRELKGCHGFCKDIYNVLVMELLGPSLEDLFNLCNRRFTLRTVLKLTDQLLDRVDTLHDRHLMHRDIKPSNFCIGVGENSNNIFCVDFGLTKRYRNPNTYAHISMREGRSLIGTPRYASVNNHLGFEQSRRDDLESVSYMLIYFLKGGKLPWQGLKAGTSNEKYSLILEKKQRISIPALCEGLPPVFAEFMAYTRALQFDSDTDVPYWRRRFKEVYEAEGYHLQIPDTWDWTGHPDLNKAEDEDVNNNNNNNNNNPKDLAKQNKRRTDERLESNNNNNNNMTNNNKYSQGARNNNNRNNNDEENEDDASGHAVADTNDG